ESGNPGEIWNSPASKGTNARGAGSFRLQPRNDLARDELDLLRLVLVWDEDDFLRSDRLMRLELLDAFVDRSHDGAVLGRLAPGREIPLLGEPFHHAALGGLPRLADEDGQLRSIEELFRVLSCLLGKAADLVPGLGEAFGRIEIGQPTVAAHRRAFEHAIDISADQDRRIWFLHRLGIHNAGGNVVAGKLSPCCVLPPRTLYE